MQWKNEKVSTILDNTKPCERKYGNKNARSTIRLNSAGWWIEIANKSYYQVRGKTGEGTRQM